MDGWQVMDKQGVLRHFFIWVQNVAICYRLAKKRCC